MFAFTVHIHASRMSHFSYMVFLISQNSSDFNISFVVS